MTRQRHAVFVQTTPLRSRQQRTLLQKQPSIQGATRGRYCTTCSNTRARGLPLQSDLEVSSQIHEIVNLKGGQIQNRYR